MKLNRFTRAVLGTMNGHPLTVAEMLALMPKLDRRSKEITYENVCETLHTLTRKRPALVKCTFPKAGGMVVGQYSITERGKEVT